MSPHIGAHVAVDDGPKSQERPILVCRHFEPAAILPGMIRRHQMLAAIFDPFNRLAQFHGGKRNQEIFWVELSADPETAADVVFDEMYFVLGKLEESRDGLP